MAIAYHMVYLHYEYHDGQVRLLAGGSSNHAAIALNLGVALDQAFSVSKSLRAPQRVGFISNMELDKAFILQVSMLP